MHGLALIGDAVFQGVMTLFIPSVLGIGVWILVAIFVWSGLAKLARAELAALALIDFGIIRDYRPTAGRLVGVLEVGIAVAILVPQLTVAAVAIAVVLLWFFVALIGLNLKAGGRFPCFCFGDIDSPISSLTLVRTAALAMLATVVGLFREPRGMEFAEGFLQIISAAAILTMGGSADNGPQSAPEET